MAVTLNNIDIETLTGIVEIQRPRLSTTPLGLHSLALAQSMKATVLQYQVNCIWTDGNNDYTAKKAKLQNIADSGLPVWFDATDWSTNTLMFGKVSDVQIIQTEGRADIWDVSFVITSVFPWGYLFVADDGVGDFRVYDLDKVVQSRTLNPMLRRCSYAKTSGASGTVTFSFYIKNVGGSNGQVTIELMVPDGLGVGGISVSPTVTEAAGDVGSAGISNTPGTLRRITLKRTINAGVEEQWDVTITFGSLKTSFLDGSLDDIAG